MEDDIKKDLKSSKVDYVHSIIKNTLSFIPGFGGVASEAFNLVISEPLSKRRDKWLIKIYESLVELQKKVDNFNIESLQNNDQFISILFKATQVAMRNHQHEKLNSLHNACINTATNISIDENEQIMFLNYIDELTIWHLRILDYFNNPIKKLKEKNISENSYSMGSPMQPLLDYFPELIEKKYLVDIMIEELYRKKLFELNHLKLTMTANGMVAPRLTKFGDDFIRYIEKNKLLDII
ncbi:hypothetical protein [Clostridium fallax]|uniref:DUF4393 domain-containing protein n=1 Tax=Clostridium fallax TaxID=1533 RepID=A0A1M4X7B4_9CLOT|nr:hypothetical protein [Clostridium fallax]SHE89341.1 hypothetical protein SAMN05443638_11633 [Clostridium fallax]SQB07338.1 Uncharacterised protein [Clostridium fallax]